MRLINIVDETQIIRRSSYGMLQDEVSKYSLRMMKIDILNANKPKIYNIKSPIGADIFSGVSNLPNRKGNKSTNHTGGAYGADSIWADMLRPYGVDNKHYRPTKDMPTKRLKDLSAKKDEIVSITKEEQNAGKDLNTKLGNSVHDLNNRNFVQILNADAVFAVAPIKDGKVQGGTGSATRMASELGKQVYVLDTETVKWMKEIDGNYVPMEELPKFPINFAAVGTRGIESYPKKNRDGSWGTTELHNNTKAILKLMQKTVDHSFGAIKDTTKQEIDIIVPTETFEQNVNRKIECKE